MPNTTPAFGPLSPPSSIFAQAGLTPFCDPLGRIAWTKTDARDAADVLARNGYAISRVELWCICNEDTYSAVIPYVDGLYGRFDFRQEDVWAPESETWEDYCIRCREWALAQLPRMNYEPMLTPDYGPEKMRVHFETLVKSDFS